MKNLSPFGSGFKVIAKKGNVYKLQNKRTKRFLVIKRNLNNFTNHLDKTEKHLIQFPDLASDTARKRFAKMSK